MLATLAARLKAAAAEGRLRKLVPRSGEDLASNDYLGFATDATLQQRVINRLQDFPLGATGSRLLRGNLDIHEQTESELALAVKREAALLFSSGFQANIALLSTLLEPDSLVFSDAFNHASLIDGIRLSGAKKIIYPHRDLQALEDALKTAQHNACRKIIVTESLFSMDGTLADLTAMSQLAQQYGAELIVDEAHSTGLWGMSLVATLGLTDQVFATIHAAGKAMGSAGAWIAGSQTLKQYLINFSRPFIFTTAPIPALTIQLQEAGRYFAEVGRQRAGVVLQRAQQVRGLLPALLPSADAGPILPILIGDNERAVSVANALQQHGWDVRAIRPPTVPEGTARLRVTVKWGNSEESLRQFAGDLENVFGTKNNA